MSRPFLLSTLVGEELVGTADRPPSGTREYGEMLAGTADASDVDGDLLVYV